MRINIGKSTDVNMQNNQEQRNPANGYEGYSDTVRKAKLRKSIIRFVLAVILILAIIAASAVLFVRIKTYYFTSNQTEDYFARAGVIENEINNNLAERNDKFAAERLNAFFKFEDKKDFSSSLWSYTLLVNDVHVDLTTTVLTVKPGDKISIKEALAQTLLPNEFVIVGSLTQGDAGDSVDNHFGFYKDAKKMADYRIEEIRDGNNTTYTTEDLALVSGDTFNMLISVQLQEKLGINSDITVNVQ